MGGKILAIFTLFPVARFPLLVDDRHNLKNILGKLVINDRVWEAFQFFAAVALSHRLRRLWPFDDFTLCLLELAVKICGKPLLALMIVGDNLKDFEPCFGKIDKTHQARILSMS